MFDKPIIEDSSTTPLQTPSSFGFANPSEFDNLIMSKGQDVDYDKAMRCPCISKQTGSAFPSCINCGGLGWFFIDRTSTKMIVVGRGQAKKQENWQETDLGVASITSRAIERMTFMDRVILKEVEAIHTEVLSMRRRSNGTLFSYTIYNPIEIEFAYLLDDKDTKLAELVPTEIFDITQFDKGVIQFVDNNKYVQEYFQKEDELKLSIRYLHNPVYHILDVNRDLTKTRNSECSQELKKSLPIKYLAKKAQYIFDNHNLSGAQIVNN